MKSQTLWILLWLSILTGGLLLRVTSLKARPMHTDESVHAYKFKQLLEDGLYRYDPQEYHGPVLNYLTLVSSFLRGERTFAQVEETTLRLVPAVLGTLLILTPLFFIHALGKRAVLFSAVLLAFSPAFVYYSRYYIQEMLLVFFTACFLGTVWKYLEQRRIGWMILAGASLGLMHASKETFAFSIAAGALAVLLVTWRCRLHWSVRLWHIVAAGVSYAVVTASFFSSFGTNWHGIVDAFATYGVWIQRAAGQSVHVHPWYYYLDLLTWMEFFEPLSWNEDGIVALAIIGIVYILVRRPARQPLACFFAVYTLLLTIIYSAIPYKTPWSMLSFLYGMAIIGGFMADRLLCIARHAATKVAFGLLLLIYGLVSPLAQSNLLAFDYASDPANPYVYAHTGSDIFPMVHQVKRAAYASGQGTAVGVQVIAEKDDYWPLPWYLRDFKNIGYWDHIDASAAGTPIILAQVRIEGPLLQTLYSGAPGQKQLYFPLFEAPVSLRPGILWQGYVCKDVWDNMQPADVKEPLESKGNLMDFTSDARQSEHLHKFSHEAMHTTMGILIRHSDSALAAGAAKAAFNEADRLERLLSRFIENSDISRLNNASSGGTVAVEEDTMRCLEKARQAFELTNGAFDTNFAARSVPFGRAVQLKPESFEVKVNADLELDLGGIGKGYAVDKMFAVLKEWSVADALIHAGESSVLAMQAPGETVEWPVTISDPQTGRNILKLLLADEVLSASGIAAGEHIIDPAAAALVTARTGCWIRLPADAALADALSTAGMIMPLDKLDALRSEIEGLSALVLTHENEQVRQVSFGDRFRLSP